MPKIRNTSYTHKHEHTHTCSSPISFVLWKLQFFFFAFSVFRFIHCQFFILLLPSSLLAHGIAARHTSASPFTTDRTLFAQLKWVPRRTMYWRCSWLNTNSSMRWIEFIVVMFAGGFLRFHQTHAQTNKRARSHAEKDMRKNKETFNWTWDENTQMLSRKAGEINLF